MKDDEIDILWRGELVLTDLICKPGYTPSHEELHQLSDLVLELKRIRMLRVQRQAARKAARTRKRWQREAELDRLSERVALWHRENSDR